MWLFLKLFSFGLVGMLCLLFVLGQIIICSDTMESQKNRKCWRLVSGSFFSFVGSLLVYYVIIAVSFHTRHPWGTLKQVIGLRRTVQDIAVLSLDCVACMIVCLIGNLILRKLIMRKENGISYAARLAVVLICSLCIGMAVVACATSVESKKKLRIVEVCRKATYYINDSEQKDKLWENSCYVKIRNTGPMAVEIDRIYLSETFEDLKALCFEEGVIQGGETILLAMNYEHGLDLKKDGGSIVYICTDGETVIDSFLVPALAENEVCRVDTTGETEKFFLIEPQAVCILEEPVFSVESGFYSDGLELELSGPEGAEIFYTLDAGNPLITGTQYTGKLILHDPTPEENKWSDRTDVSATFLTDEPIFTLPTEPVDKCVVVRAVCRDKEGNISRTVSRSYFIGYDDRSGYDGIGMISLVTDPDNLFDENKGIYVLGRTFEESSDAAKNNEEWWWRPANYHMRGREWEREAEITFFDSDHVIQLEGPIGVRVKGESSSAFVPKGLNLYARKDYGMQEFENDLFGNGYIANKLALSGGGNDTNLKIRDWLTARMAGDLGITMNRFVPYCLFLDGEYWGNYWLTETFDDSFFSHEYGVNENNIVIVKNGSLKGGIPEDREDYDRFVEFFSTKDLSDPEIYKEACEMVDMDNFSLYYALEIYIANHDKELERNTLLWRARKKEDSPEADTRWRQVLFDVNTLSTFTFSEVDTIGRVRETDAVYDNLMNSVFFRESFFSNLRMLATEVFNPERANEALSEYEALMTEPMDKEHTRFNSTLSGVEGLEKIKAFFPARQKYILNLCDKEAEDG